jgi:hypothetical protein
MLSWPRRSRRRISPKGRRCRNSTTRVREDPGSAFTGGYRPPRSAAARASPRSHRHAPSPKSAATRDLREGIGRWDPPRRGRPHGAPPLCTLTRDLLRRPTRGALPPLSPYTFIGGRRSPPPPPNLYRGAVS